MPARTHAVQVVFLVLCIGLFVLQSGCSTSGGGGNTGAPTGNANALHLALTSPSGSTAVVADGHSTIPLRMQVTNGSGAGVSGLSVTFATTAGTLSPSSVARTSLDLLSADQADQADQPATIRADSSGSVTVITDANGIAQVFLTASTVAGTAVVTADVQGFRANIVIEFVPGPPARVQLTASSTTVNPAGTATLTATATDANGNRVPGETVLFSFSTNSSGACLTTGSSTCPSPTASGVTNSSGQVTAKYTAGSTPGADTVQATATSTGVFGSISITVPESQNVSQVTGVTVVAGASSVVADGTSGVAIRATVTVASGSPAGIMVTFSTTAGRLSPAAARTDANGVAIVTLIAAASLGRATVTASAGGFNASVTIDFVAGATAVILLSTTPPTVTPGDTATITATVTDVNSNPISGQTLTFSLLTNASGATLSPLVGATDTNGQLKVTYTAGATPGTDTVQARAANGVIGTANITVTSAPPGNITGITVVAGASSIPADGKSTVAIRATVSVSSGSRAGIVVTFSTTAGRLSPDTTSTDTNGVATVSLIAATSLGSATVTASAGGFSANVTVSFVAGATAVILLSTNPPTVKPGGSSTITATVTDANSNPISGQTLIFSLPTNTSGATLSPLIGATDASGQFVVTYTAGTTPGTDTVRARAANGVTGTATITVTSVPPGNITGITLVAGASSIPADGVSTVALRATVRVSSGSPAGIVVTFTTTAGRLSPAVTSTDANGVATVNLIAATSVGTATVTASAGGFNASVTVTFVAAGVTKITLSATPPSVPVGGTSMIQAAVTDANGNPTPGQTLVFSFVTNASGATLTPLTGVTDASGRFTVTYTAGTTPGTDTVQARTADGTTGTVSITVTAPGGASSINLLVSSPQLGSNGAGSVTLTALLRDANNNTVSGAPVSFSADSGSIQVISGTTGPTGTATALLTTGGDPTNRTITVKAKTGNLSATNTVQVTGTTLSISGATTLVLQNTTKLTILLRDSGGTGIPGRAISVTALNNSLSTTSTTTCMPVTKTITVTTDVTGQAFVFVRACVSGTDTITATALGATAMATLSVSADNFIFCSDVTHTKLGNDCTTPAPDGTEVNLNTPQPVTVHWDKTPGGNQVGQPINFFATRGNFAIPANPCPGAGAGPTTCAITDPNGNATVTISADNAGPSIISAVANVANGPSNEVEIEFIATTVDSLVLQAFPTTIGVNPPGSTTQQSVITAVARDAQGNLVKNKTVSFSLQDVTGGHIFPAFAVTDSFGQASTVYTAGAVPSAHDGVVITATAGSPPVTATVKLTVAQRPLFVVLGTANTFDPSDPTQYALRYSVLVTDADGNAVAGAIVNLNVLPTRYRKGSYTKAFDMAMPPNCVGWRQVVIDTCQNEDINHNGILDPGEDFNHNGRLDPGNVATAPSTVTTDTSGFAFFDVVYAKQFATWVEVALQARAVVAGTEGSSQAQFFLPGASSDFNNCTVLPPEQISPFGVMTCPFPS